MKPDRFKIIVKRYGRYWDEEDVVVHTGMNKDQMLNLFDRYKSMQLGSKTLSVRLENEKGEILEQQDL